MIAAVVGRDDVVAMLDAEPRRRRPELKGSVGEGSDSTRLFRSDFGQNSFKIQEFSLENSKIPENFNILTFF